MSDYYTLRTKPIFSKPVGAPDLGSSTAAYGNLYLRSNVFISNSAVNTLKIPRITNITYTPGRSTANVSGNESLTLTGTGFDSNSVVMINTRPADTTTFVSSTQLSFTTTPQTVGNYPLFVVNSDGSTGVSATGITYS